MEGRHITPDQVSSDLEASPDKGGWQSVSYLLERGDTLNETFTSYPRGRTYEGPVMVTVTRTAGTGVTVSVKQNDADA